MNIRGRRIHIVGSADPEADEAKLIYAHRLIAELVTALASEARFSSFPSAKNRFLRTRNGPSIIFDWTVAEAVHNTLKAGKAAPTGPNGRLVATLATSKTDGQIPIRRRPIYDDLRELEAVRLEFMEPGWSAGGIVEDGWPNRATCSSG